MKVATFLRLVNTVNTANLLIFAKLIAHAIPQINSGTVMPVSIVNMPQHAAYADYAIQEALWTLLLRTSAKLKSTPSPYLLPLVLLTFQLLLPKWPIPSMVTSSHTI